MKNDYSNRIARLTALWALNEAGLGGMMHAMQFPFTGLFVGGFAIVLICLIAHYSEHPFPSVMKSALLVLIIKAAVSPYSPPPAYIAVLFQAVLSATIFSISPWFRFNALLIGVLTLFESAIQKILILWLMFGKALPMAIDNFIGDLLNTFHFSSGTPYTQWIVGAFILTYAVCGLIIGWWIGTLPRKIETERMAYLEMLHKLRFENESVLPPKKKRITRYLLFFGCLVLLMLLPSGGKGWVAGVQSILRALSILLLWLFIIAPFLHKIVRSFLKNKQTQHAREIDDLMQQSAKIQRYIQPVWELSKKERRGFGRISFFILFILLVTTEENIDSNTLILGNNSQNPD